MSKQPRKPVEPIPPAKSFSPRDLVLRLFAKVKLKDAVKEAKLCYKSDPSPENHQLLEQAYYRRARQLVAEGMVRSGAEVAQHLLDFGVTDPAITAELPDLLVSVGLSMLALGMEIGSKEDQERLKRTAADHAVLHPETSARGSSEIREGAQRIRQAMEALDGGHEPRALELLASIARSSPFADWRLFVRGLAAYRRDDASQVEANWGRLETGRAAERIARALQSLEKPDEGKLTPTRRDWLETELFGAAISQTLTTLKSSVLSEDWSNVTILLTSARNGLRKIDPSLSIRLTQILLSSLTRYVTEISYRDARKLISQFSRAADPLPNDPHWNRMWAMIWEGPQGELETAEDFWNQYIGDLKRIPTFREDERVLIEALIWKHLGEQYFELYQECIHDPSARLTAPPPHDITRRIERHFEQSLKLVPRHLPTLRSFKLAMHTLGETKQFHEISLRTLEFFPDDIETLTDLTHDYLIADDPVHALPLIQHLRSLRPLDPSYARLEPRARLQLTRQHTIARRYAQARAELETIARVDPETARSFPYLVRKALVEGKAGNAEAGDAAIAEAEKSAGFAAPAWLVYRIEAVRYKLPRAKLDAINRRLQEEFAQKPVPAIAAMMASILYAYKSDQVKFTGQATLQKQVADYCDRCAKTRFNEKQLIEVCLFLEIHGKSKSSLKKFRDQGVKAFKESPYFLMCSALAKLDRRRTFSELRMARELISKALQLANASSRPEDRDMVPRIKEVYTRISDMLDSPMFRDFGFPERLQLLFQQLAMQEDEDYDEDDPFFED